MIDYQMHVLILGMGTQIVNQGITTVIKNTLQEEVPQSGIIIRKHFASCSHKMKSFKIEPVIPVIKKTAITVIILTWITPTTPETLALQVGVIPDSLLLVVPDARAQCPPAPGALQDIYYNCSSSHSHFY